MPVVPDKMPRMGILQSRFAGTSAGQAWREAVNARFVGELGRESTELLRTKVMEQREDLRELATVISVLVDMLAEAGALDESKLRSRVQNERAAMDEAAKHRTVTCASCRREVAIAQTTITGDGVVCDRCAG